MKQLKKKQFTYQKLALKSEEIVFTVALVAAASIAVSVIVTKAVGFYLIDKIKGK